jgi:hypothetical protein
MSVRNETEFIELVEFYAGAGLTSDIIPRPMCLCVEGEEALPTIIKRRKGLL